MPSKKKHPLECTIDEALNDFWHDATEAGPSRKRRKIYEPIPIDPPSPSLGANTTGFSHEGNHTQHGIFHDEETRNVVEHDIGPSASLVKGKVSSSAFVRVVTPFTHESTAVTDTE